MVNLAGTVDPDAPHQGPSLSYIPALDGIRGVAIVVIMGYHSGVLLTSGGFYSLDMFFTLSGFLITSLLISEWQRTSTIRLWRFWARRARRLLPALLVMLLGVAIFAAFLVPAGTYPTLRGDAFSALFYFANWHFIAAGSNYFNQSELTSPLTHTWSLAVEEQFYLVWPLVVLGLLALWKNLRVLLVVCLAGALASAIEMAVLYNPGDVDRLYYGTDTRPNRSSSARHWRWPSRCGLTIAAGPSGVGPEAVRPRATCPRHGSVATRRGPLGPPVGARSCWRWGSRVSPSAPHYGRWSPPTIPWRTAAGSCWPRSPPLPC